MQPGDKYISKKDTNIRCIIKKVDATYMPFGSIITVEYDWWDEKWAYGQHAIPAKHDLAFFSNEWEPLYAAKHDDAVAAMKDVFGLFINPPPLPKCECGANKLGYKDHTKQHSHWCKMYKGD